MEESTIIRTMTRKLFPFILLFGLYLVAYGHLSPGGGFQGGVVIGSAIILLSLSQGLSKTEERFKKNILGLMESIGPLVFMMIGLGGILFGYHFLKDFLPQGEGGRFGGSGFILFLNLAIGLKVGAAMSIMFYSLAGEEEG